MFQVLRTTWYKSFALAEVLNMSSRRSEIIEALVWLNERFRQSRANWVLQNSILISKTLRKRFIKYLRTLARVIIRCLRNHLLNCVLVVNLILKGFSRVIMLLNLIPQPRDYSRDRAKVVPRGSTSPTVPPRFKPLFSLDGNVEDSEPYKALAELARDPVNNGLNSNAIFHRIGEKRSSRS